MTRIEGGECIDWLAATIVIYFVGIFAIRRA